MFSNSNLESTTLTLKSQQHDLVGVVVNHSHISRAASCSEPQPGPLAFERPVIVCFLRGPAPVWQPTAQTPRSVDSAAAAQRGEHPAAGSARHLASREAAQASPPHRSASAFLVGFRWRKHKKNGPCVEPQFWRPVSPVSTSRPPRPGPHVDTDIVICL